MLVTIVGNNPGLMVHRIRRELIELLRRIPGNKRRIKVITITHKKIVVIAEEGIDRDTIDRIIEILKRYGMEVQITKEVIRA